MPAEGSSMGADEEGKAPGIKRELSVEDLFDPLTRLDVRHPSSSTAPSAAAVTNPNLKSGHSVSEDVHPSADSSRPRVSVFETHLAVQHQSGALVAGADHYRVQNPNSSAARLNSSLLLDMTPIPEETGIGFAEKPGVRTHGFTMDCTTEEGGFGSGFAHTKEKVRTKGSSIASVSDTGVQTQENSSSGEDQHVVDDRKQRRMLSNRESARRSRLRKQQHLDELQGHVAQLRAQNSQMLNSFNLASQQYAQITEENRKLRSEAMDLSHKLQCLHHTVTSQRANNGLHYGADSRKQVPAPQY